VYATGQKGTPVRLLVRAPNGGVSAALQVSPADKEGCPQFGVSVAARAGRVLVSYVRAVGGYCSVVSGTNSRSTVHLIGGTPSHLVSIASGLPKTANCGDTGLSTDGELFRLVAGCNVVVGQPQGNLYYKREFLDVVGPKSRFAVPRHTAPGRVRLAWSAHDPPPGSGVGSYQLEVRSSGSPWRLVAGATQAHSVVYPTRKGIKYTFRLRARDRVNNWGRWVEIRARGT
jgi:hypothetical protein